MKVVVVALVTINVEVHEPEFLDRNLNVTIVTCISCLGCIGMNENHRRVLGAYLKDIEEKLQALQRNLDAGLRETGRVACAQTSDVNDTLRMKLENGISDMLRQIESMRLEYELEFSEPPSMRKLANTIFLDIDVTINELRPKSLENYGSLTQTDIDRLEPELDGLLRILDSLFSVVENMK